MNDLSISQGMFMLLFSILYGIMLNAAIGLRAFAYGYAFAGEAVKKCEKKKQSEIEKPSSVTRFRVFAALFLYNILPFIYFALILSQIECIVGEISLPNYGHTVFQILCIGFFSLAVLAFHRLFIGLIVWAPCGRCRIYTPDERDRIMYERCIHRTAEYQFVTAFILLFGLPWFFVGLLKIVECLF